MSYFNNTQKKLDQYFQISQRKSSISVEITAGLTTFLAMVYSVIVVPSMLGVAGFHQGGVFIAACIISAFGSMLMGLWANLPMAIGCAISLTAFTAFSLVLGQGISVPVALGAVFLMGVVFSVISFLGIRQWILTNLPKGIAYGTGVGIGLFLLLIAAESVGLVIKNPHDGLPITLGDLSSLPVLMSILGLACILGVEKRKIPGGILWVILAISALGLLLDEQVIFQGIVSLPSFRPEDTLFFDMNVQGALNATVIPIVLALVMTAVFDATATIRAVGGQAKLLDENDQIINGGKALSSDSLSSVVAGCVGGAPAAVYIESVAGTAAGAKTGLCAVVVGLLFIATMFFSPLVYLVPAYATAPALMYVGLLMMKSIIAIDFTDSVDAFSGLTCAVFIVLTGNIVTGIMLGYVILCLGRVIAGEVEKLNIGTIAIALALSAFYLGGWAI